MLFFFKQKTAYEMRISDWSSDVCSSDLNQAFPTSRVMRKRSAYEAISSSQDIDGRYSCPAGVHHGHIDRVRTGHRHGWRGEHHRRECAGDAAAIAQSEPQIGSAPV